MDSLAVQLGLVALLVLINAALAGSEMALVSLRDSQVARLAERGRAGAALARLAEQPNSFLATIQVGITLSGFLASATAAVSLAEPLVAPLQPVVGTAAEAVAVVAVTAALTFLTLVFGELAPKRVAMSRAEGWALVAARPLTLFGLLARPVVWLLGRSTSLVVRAVGVDPDAGKEEISEEELRDMVAAQPELSDQERLILDGAFEFADRRLTQILVPRTTVVSLPADLEVAEAARQLAATGHTRAPVVGGDLDDVVGTVHLRDLIGQDGPIGPLAQEVLVLPETAGCLAALRQMQMARAQMALVINEHGGTEGIVTIEDLVEELVGEIWDEADPDVQHVVHHPDGTMTLDGAYPVHDLDEVGVVLPEGPYTTVAGLMTAEAGRLLATGEVVVVEGVELEVTEASDRQIRRVHVRPAPAGPEEPAEG